MSQAVSEWYFNGQEVVVVSDCIGWNCVNACGVNLWTGLQCTIGGPQGPGCTPLTLAVDNHGTTSTDETGEVPSDQLPQLMQHAQNLQHKPVPAPPTLLANLNSAAAGLSTAEQALFGTNSPLAQSLASPTARLAPAGGQVAAAAPDLRGMNPQVAKLRAYWHREQPLVDHWYRPQEWQSQAARRAHLASAGCCGTDADGEPVPANV
jgi:hypothetical protein